MSFNISNYFKKFTGFVSREKIVRERCVEAVYLFCARRLDEKTIKVDEVSVSITLHPTIKHHILQSSDEIVAHINTNPFGFRVTTLR